MIRSIVPAKPCAITAFGSWTKARLPEDLGLFYRKDVLIDLRNGSPMEMDAYSLYLGLRAIERRDGVDLAMHRTKLVDAVVKRYEQCGHFWQHGAWTGSSSEIHMRFTAAAIRLLAEADYDGLSSTTPIISDALRKHLSFADEIDGGTWFLHDSFEAADSTLAHPHRPTRNNVWGSSTRNCLVLNTHADTLLTIIHVLRRVNLSDTDRNYFTCSLERGVGALKYVLDVGAPTKRISLRNIFAKADCVARDILFGSFAQPPSFLKKVKKRLILRAYYRIRQQIKVWLPLFGFPDGYTERDISLYGDGFEYHLANVYDLARLLPHFRQGSEFADEDAFRMCAETVDRGIDYAVHSNYRHYMQHGLGIAERGMMLCEAILVRLSTIPDANVPPSWTKAYCQIRRSALPTSAIMGYDPLTVGISPLLPRFKDGWDIGTLLDGRTYAIDYINDTFLIGGAADETLGIPDGNRFNA